MKNISKEVLRCVLFVSIFIAMFVAFSIHYKQVTKNDFDAYRRIFDHFSKSNPIILFVGDSHPLDDISPTELGDKYFNLSWGSDNIRQMLLKLDYAIKQKSSIRYIAIPVDYHTFSEYRHLNKSYSRDLYYSNNAKLIKELYNTNIITYYKELITRHVPLMSARNWEKYFLILLANADRAFFDNKVHVKTKINNNWSNLSRNERLRRTVIRVNEQLRDPIVNEEMVDVFDTFISFCGKNNIKIIGIRFPLSKGYIDVSKKYNIESVRKTYESREKHFICILEYRDLFINRPEYFKNTDHLTVEGAKVFTKILKRDIEQKVFGRNYAIAECSDD